jgi:hypothetical protein
VRRQVTSQPVRRRAAPGPLELRRLRGGVFRTGRFVGQDTRALVGFSEVGTDQRWQRGRNDLEEVLSELVEIASPRVIQVRSDDTRKRTHGMGDRER